MSFPEGALSVKFKRDSHNNFTLVPVVDRFVRKSKEIIKFREGQNNFLRTYKKTKDIL